MSLPSIQTLTITSPKHHHLILAVILILKHATFLRLTKLTSGSALTHADLDYQEANVDLKIQLLMASSQEHSVVLFVDFIMATDIECMHPAQDSDISVPSQSSRKKDHWFKKVFKFTRRSISLPKLRNDK